MLVKKAQRIDFECVVRGYISGSLWKEYVAAIAERPGQAVNLHGYVFPPGLQESEKLPQPIFTPATKADTGHDENVSYEVMRDALGEELAAAHHLSRPVAASGTAGDLSQKLKRPFAGSKIGKAQRKIGADDAHQRNIWKIVALGHHLSPDQDVDGLIIEAFKQFNNGPLSGSRIPIHVGDAGMG